MASKGGDPARLPDHLLKDGAAVIGRRGPRLDVLDGHPVPLALAPLPHLAELVRDGQVLLGLLDGGDSSI